MLNKNFLTFGNAKQCLIQNSEQSDLRLSSFLNVNTDLWWMDSKWIWVSQYRDWFEVMGSSGQNLHRTMCE
jgi:hypothetical protein